MKKATDLFSNQKNNSQTKQAKKNIPPGFLEMLRQSGEIYNPEAGSAENERDKKEQGDKERKENIYFQKTKRLEKEVYNHKKRETQKEIEILQKMLAKEAGKLNQKGKKLEGNIREAYHKPIINPGKSDISYLRNVISFVKDLIKNVEEANLWLSAWKDKGKKRGAFWSNFSSKKGGAQYLLSGEHSPARSAG
jgi:hypothetical protein